MFMFKAESIVLAFQKQTVHTNCLNCCRVLAFQKQTVKLLKLLQSTPLLDCCDMYILQ